MRLVPIESETARGLDRLGSGGFRAAPLARRRGRRVACVHLAPLDRVGRRLLALAAGEGAAGGAGEGAAGGAGAVCEPGEEHETRTASGPIAVAVEDADVDVPTAG